MPDRPDRLLDYIARTRRKLDRLEAYARQQQRERDKEEEEKKRRRRRMRGIEGGKAPRPIVEVELLCG